MIQRYDMVQFTVGLALFLFAKCVTCDRELVSKCCRFDEQLSSDFKKCQRVRDLSTMFSHIGEVIDMKPEINEMQWRLENLLGLHDHKVRVRRPACTERTTLHLVSSRDSERILLKNNGHLVVNAPTARNSSTRLVYSPDEYCVDTFQNENDARQKVFLVCPCDRVQCVSKCCPFGYIMVCSGLQCQCEKSNLEWIPFHSKEQLDNETDITYEVFENNAPPCATGEHLWFDNPIYRPHHVTKHWWHYPYGHLFVKYLEKCGEIVMKRHSRTTYTTIGYCYEALPFNGLFEIGSSLHAPAVVFLAITIFVLNVTSKPRISSYGQLHRLALQCHTAALLVGNFILAMYPISDDETTFCRATPVVMNFSLMAAAFWLNAICLNMACGFCTPSGTHTGSPTSGRRLFLYYSVYAWGCPALLSAFTAAMWYSKDVPSGWLRPTLMETRRCFWEDENGAVKLATFAYFYGPIFTLLFANASLFIFIAYRVRRLRRRSSILERKDSNLHLYDRPHRSALLYVKLLWLMGVAEMAVEVGAWAAHSGGFYYLIAADVIDLLRAVSIFVLCVCKKRTLRDLRGSLRTFLSFDSRRHHRGCAVGAQQVLGHAAAAVAAAGVIDGMDMPRAVEMDRFPDKERTSSETMSSGCVNSDVDMITDRT